jgi:FKBP-type peptidyl-prolyl cis-trans isomerase SlyD
VKIANGMVVSIDYTLHLGDGEIVDSSEEGEPLQYVHGVGQIVAGLERALLGLEKDARTQVVVTPGDAYGEHDPAGVQEVPKQDFGDELPELGRPYPARGPEGEMVPFVVKEIREDVIVVDLNHPLAGRTLHFDVAVVGVREASPEELQHGHAHGPGGHHHD